MSSLSPSSLQSNGRFYTSAAVFLLGSIALVVDSGYSVGAALLFLGGLCIVFTRNKPSLEHADHLIIGVLVTFGLVDILDIIVHQAGTRPLDKPLRFVLAGIAFYLVRKYPPKLGCMWAGLAVGGILTALWAGHQKFFLDIYRASGYTHVIQFGNISMLTGFLCLAGLGWTRAQPRRIAWTLVLLLGALGGVLGSLLSGSRGGWVGLPLVLLVLYRAYGDFFSSRIKLRLVALIVGGAVVVYSVPQFGVQGRVHEALNDVRQYKEGNSNTSVGARFEMWKGASQLFLAKPLFGWGEINYDAGMQELVAQGKVDKVVTRFGHPHNEVLNSAAKRGLLGLAALLALYLVPLRLFAPGLRASDLTQRSLATAGTLLSVAYIDFGLSQAFFAHNSGVMIYAFWLVVLWGCYRNAGGGVRAA